MHFLLWRYTSFHHSLIQSKIESMSNHDTVWLYTIIASWTIVCEMVSEFLLKVLTYQKNTVYICLSDNDNETIHMNLECTE